MTETGAGALVSVMFPAPPRVKLRFDAIQSQSKTIFVFARQLEATPVAQLRLEFQAFKRPPDTPDSGPLPLMIFPPKIGEPDDRKGVLVPLHSVSANVRLSIQNQRLYSSNNALGEQFAFLNSDQRDPPPYLLPELLQSLARWRSRPEFGSPLSTHRQAFQFLRYLGLLVSDLHRGTFDERKVARRIRARVLAKVRDNGLLLEDLSDLDWQQYDFELKAESEPAIVALRLTIPDLLTKGRLHLQFMDAIAQSRSLAQRLRESTQFLGGVSLYLDDIEPALSCSVRVGHGENGLDKNVFLLHFRSGHRALVMANVKVTAYPDSQFQALDGEELVALFRPEIDLAYKSDPWHWMDREAADREMLERYLDRVLRLILLWTEGAK